MRLDAGRAVAADPRQKIFRHEFDRTGRVSADSEVAMASENRKVIWTHAHTNDWFSDFGDFVRDSCGWPRCMAHATTYLTCYYITINVIQRLIAENFAVQQKLKDAAVWRSRTCNPFLFSPLLALCLSQNSGARGFHYTAYLATRWCKRHAVNMHRPLANRCVMEPDSHRM